MPFPAGEIPLVQVLLGMPQAQIWLDPSQAVTWEERTARMKSKIPVYLSCVSFKLGILWKEEVLDCVVSHSFFFIFQF